MNYFAIPTCSQGFRTLLFIALGYWVAGPSTLIARQERDNGRETRLNQELQGIVDDVVQRFELPGMMAGVLQDGTLVAQACCGLRNVDHAESPLAIGDKGHLGSCSKAFTATLAGILVDDDVIDWDDTIAKRLPQIADAIDPAYHDVTLWQLLTHTGGIQANGAAWLGGGAAAHENRLRIVAAGLKTKPAKLRFGRYSYSNLGYITAAAMMESASGRSWEELMRQRIFEPLDLKSAGFGPPSTGKQIDQPWGHVVNGDQIVPTLRDNPPSMAPAGTIHANLADWARFVSVHMADQSAGDSIISDRTRAFLHTPPQGTGSRPYAGGWLVVKIAGGGYELRHEGSNTFWLASAIVRPESGLAILIVTNHAMQPSLPANAEAIRRIRKIVD